MSCPQMEDGVSGSANPVKPRHKRGRETKIKIKMKKEKGRKQKRKQKEGTTTDASCGQRPGVLRL